jgi:hypothetical protein
MSHVPYASAVGSLMYAMVCTRLDIAHAVGVLSKYMFVTPCFPQFVKITILAKNCGKLKNVNV